MKNTDNVLKKNMKWKKLKSTHPSECCGLVFAVGNLFLTILPNKKKFSFVWSGCKQLMIYKSRLGYAGYDPNIGIAVGKYSFL